MCLTVRQVPTVQSWLSGSQNSVSVDAAVAEHITVSAEVKLREAVKRNFEEPLARLHWFSECICYQSGLSLVYT